MVLYQYYPNYYLVYYNSLNIKRVIADKINFIKNDILNN